MIPGRFDGVCGQRTMAGTRKFQRGFLEDLTVATVGLLSHEPILHFWRWWKNVRPSSITAAVAVVALLPIACLAADRDSTTRMKSGIESVYTDLSPQSCRKELDKTDPNETPYLVCPGVAGYALTIRRVDAGRRSIDVVDPAQQVHPLQYQEFVTRHMFTLDLKAEWRVITKDRKQVPIALIVRVKAREDDNNPDKVTHTYLVVAKIEPNEACVTDTIPVGTRSDTAVRSTADSARERQCAPPQPRMTTDGVVIR